MGFEFQQIPVPDNQPVQAWVGIPANSPNNPGNVLYQNSDLNNTIYLGTNPSFSPGQPNCLPIPPNGSITLPAMMSVWVTGGVSGIQPLIVVPGGSSQFLGLTQSGGTLVLPQIQSQGFVSGASGWRIQSDGNAEFNDITLRGQFVGNEWIVNDLGIFFYSGPPALGNLEGSAANSTGLDAFGNKFYRGVATYKNGFVVTLIDSILGASFQYQSPSGSQGGLIVAISSTGGNDPVLNTPYPFGLAGFDPVFGDTFQGQGARVQFGQVPFTLEAQVSANVTDGSNPDSQGFLIVQAPEVNNQSGHMCILIEGTSVDGTRPGQILMANIATAGAAPTPVTTQMIEVHGGQSCYVLCLVNQSSPPTTFSGGPIFFSLNGTPSVVNADGMSGAVAISQSDASVLSATTTSFVNVTKAWTIEANDPNVGTTYVIEAFGNGVQWNTTAEDIVLQVVAGGTVSASMQLHISSLIGLALAFSWEAKAVVSINSTGSGGTANVFLKGTISVFAGTIVEGSNTIPFVRQNTNQAFNTTVGQTVEIQAKWTATGGSGGTFTGQGSTFDRKGA